MTRTPEPPAAATDAAPPPGPPEPTDEAPARTPLFGKVVVGLALLIAVIGIAGARITLPYVIFSPGDATPVDDYMKIAGARSYHHSGSLLLLTVRVSNGQPNVWRFVQASLDDDSKVVGEKDYFGGTPRGKVDKQDVQQMPCACDVQTKLHDTCRGWHDFTNDQLAAYYEQIVGKPVRVV